MMKKLLFAVFAAASLVACNSKAGPEYTTPPVVFGTTYMPKTVLSSDKVTVKATVTSEYGLQRIMIYYYVGDNSMDVSTAYQQLYNIKGETKQLIEGTIPAHKAGTKITFQVVAVTPYNVAGGSEAIEYTVETDPTDVPEEK